MQDGVLSEWLVADGAEVQEGQQIYSLESDKAVTEVESPVAGKLTQIGEIGQTYKVGEVLGEIEEAD